MEAMKMNDLVIVGVAGGDGCRLHIREERICLL